jgi:hypothetical protein
MAALIAVVAIIALLLAAAMGGFGGLGFGGDEKSSGGTVNCQKDPFAPECIDNEQTLEGGQTR